MTDFEYFVEQFDDIKILRYQVPAFERLTLREKLFVYHLSRAALAGRDILWDQNNRYNLEVRAVLEKILRDYPGDRDCEAFRHFLVYAKKVFFANGVHHHYSMEKFMPCFTRDYFLALARAAGVPFVREEVLRLLFDPAFMAKRVVLTGTVGSRLEEIAKENGCTFLHFPRRVGGRYSAFTPVALLPLAVAGLDVDAYLAGGLAMEEGLAKNEGGLAAEYAAVRYALYRRGFKVEMLTAFEPRLFWAEQWWKQLFGESEGKEKKGMLPASMINSEDLHSMGQYMQDGLRFMTETFLAVDDPGASVVIEPDPDFGDAFDYLDGMDFANINRAAEKATIQAHAAGGVPCMVLRLPRIDEHTFGLVYYFFMVACALSGRLLGVDPFDQEGVEEYKRSMFAALGKPGVKGR